MWSLDWALNYLHGNLKASLLLLFSFVLDKRMNCVRISMCNLFFMWTQASQALIQSPCFRRGSVMGPYLIPSLLPCASSFEVDGSRSFCTVQCAWFSFSLEYCHVAWGLSWFVSSLSLAHKAGLDWILTRSQASFTSFSFLSPPTKVVVASQRCVHFVF